MNKLVIAALLATTMSTGAFAAPIALDGSFATNLSNKTYDAVFSGKSFLPEDYVVNGLSFSFSFLDAGGNFKDAAPVQTGYKSTGYGFHSYDRHSITFARYVNIEQTITRSSEQERAQLSIGDIVLGSGATTLNEQTSSGGSTFARVNDAAYCAYTFCKYLDSKITTKTSILTKDYTGGFTISGIITNQSIIDQLLGNGELTLSLDIFGKLKLTDAQVLLDYTEVEAPAEQPGEVPEPSSVLLAGAGLAAIGFLRRRRSAAQA
jgi:hypothetical protein